MKNEHPDYVIPKQNEYNCTQCSLKFHALYEFCAHAYEEHRKSVDRLIPYETAVQLIESNKLICS